MEELEVKKLRKKTLTVVLYEEGNSKEVNSHDDCFTEQADNPIVDMLLNYRPDFVTAEKNCMYSADGQNVKMEEFKEFGVPLFRLGIPNNARMYMEQEIDDVREEVKELKEELERYLAKDPENANTYKGQNMKSLIEFYEKEADEKERYMNTEVMARWIVKQMVDLANEVPEKEVTCIHVSSTHLFLELAKQMNEAGFVVLPIRVNAQMEPDELMH
ncbi:MAG: hypothetical protein ACUVXA_09855 [Candidatus Jordarchaeum sp.]|uniref:hypothetical protein n=1 Tax=Candidatus Jordarchaeum sp. TaxID=2823881 RepID=UPI00404A977B